jgi:hypothetical protein
MSAIGTKRTWLFAPHMSAYDPKRTKAASLSTFYATVMVFRAISPVADLAQSILCGPQQSIGVSLSDEGLVHLETSVTYVLGSRVLR